MTTTTFLQTPSPNVNPTVKVCPKCNGACAVTMDPEKRCFTDCIHCGPIPVPGEAGAFVDSLRGTYFNSTDWPWKRLVLTLKRNHWVMEMTRVPRDETIYTSFDGPGTNDYTRCSYEIGKLDYDLFQNGWL